MGGGVLWGMRKTFPHAGSSMARSRSTVASSAARSGIRGS